ncbi:general stress protein [Brachybacterium endophyticum]|uniref:General stress protein n=1 Tax=Brachybacterium endophyticum TaxID=2182385 RepID=A0A2U2RN01_9MICO|nr:pyridoxamine 5'-phosphate oxidase family protein [Brachybacterium endophyticum]PWH07211.1 general stress protein [Brachybacterium endophyticum]
MTTEDLSQDTVVDTLRESRFVMLTTARADGTLLSHPMTAQEVTDDADVWFFVGLQGDQADALHGNPHVNIAVAKAGTWLSVAGRVEFVDDRAKIDELWDDEAGAYFEHGKEDPNVGLIRVTSDSAQFWGLPGGRASALAKITKARLTGQKPGGSSATTEL